MMGPNRSKVQVNFTPYLVAVMKDSFVKPKPPFLPMLRHFTPFHLVADVACHLTIPKKSTEPPGSLNYSSELPNFSGAPPSLPPEHILSNTSMSQHYAKELSLQSGLLCFA